MEPRQNNSPLAAVLANEFALLVLHHHEPGAWGDGFNPAGFQVGLNVLAQGRLVALVPRGDIGHDELPPARKCGQVFAKDRRYPDDNRLTRAGRLAGHAPDDGAGQVGFIPSERRGVPEPQAGECADHEERSHFARGGFEDQLEFFDGERALVLGDVFPAGDLRERVHGQPAGLFQRRAERPHERDELVHTVAGQAPLLKVAHERGGIVGGHVAEEYGLGVPLVQPVGEQRQVAPVVGQRAGPRPAWAAFGLQIALPCVRELQWRVGLVVELGGLLGGGVGAGLDRLERLGFVGGADRGHDAFGGGLGVALLGGVQALDDFAAGDPVLQVPLLAALEQVAGSLLHGRPPG
ncbi:MAG: hypothetical protein BWY59_01750 [Verrucomicrobia bacterium ADurb.Bin345]|nr:MAG: hypothetical protein BWY59_01750 [Verrucomicrobia bacterium ADurb.Bin345]